MKKTAKKKLVLAKETVAILEREDVHVARGGASEDFWSACYVHQCDARQYSFTCTSVAR